MWQREVVLCQVSLHAVGRRVLDYYQIQVSGTGQVL